MRILIAPDKYKGSLTATQVAEIICGELAGALPNLEFDLCPIADGGEGTTEAMVTALEGTWVTAEVLDAQMRPRVARYGWIESRGEAVMEMSAASGLAMVTDLPLNPLTATTLGTGQMIEDALLRGAERMVIGIGGSATNDGGLGMAAALGYRFIDEEGADVIALMQEVHRAVRIEAPASWRGAQVPEILVACDVNNPLLGARGATRIYGPQKGVEDFEFFESRLRHLADLVSRDLGVDPREEAGAGAAGGLGFGLMAFCGAKLTSGFDLVAEQIGVEARIAQADLVITGEGRLDAQTLHGKGPAGVAQMAQRAKKPVVAFAGGVDASPALAEAFHFAQAITPAGMPLPEALARAEELLALAVRERSGEIRALLGLA
ncbi:MAG TPA: glycerate kinase, partial [Prosthecobacter sp.]|nr:glycerate kinase [Prosthecobacter sp.]